MFTRKLLNAMLLGGGALLLVLLFQPVMADTVDVSIPGFSFDPAVLSIEEGMTVKWTNNHTIPHTSTSDDAIWDSGSLSPGAAFSYTFDSLGTFPYHCTFHPTMLGTITVTPSTQIPTITPYGVIILIALIAISAIMIYRRKKLGPAN